MKQPAAISSQVCDALRKVLKDSRESAGLSVNELSKRAGLNRQAVTFIERGERVPTMDSFIRLSAALGLPPADLLTRAQQVLGKTDWEQIGKQIKGARTE